MSGYLLIVEFEAHPQNRIPHIVLPLPNIKQGLAKVAAQVQIRADIEAVCNVIPAVIKSLAELPAALPCLFVGIWRSGAVENSFSVDGAEVGEGVAEGPAFLQGCRESPNFRFLNTVYMGTKIVNISILFVSICLWYHCSKGSETALDGKEA